MAYLSWPRPPELDGALWFRQFLHALRPEAITVSARADLPPPYDPKRWLATAGWPEIESWGRGTSEAPLEAVRRRMPAHWVLLGTREGPDVLGALSAEVGDLQIRLETDPLDLEPLEAALQALPDDREYTFVFVAHGPAIHTVLRALHASAGLRDRTLAVVSVAGVLQGAHGGLTEADVDGWMAKHFGHRAFETEMDHPVPFFALRWDDGSGGAHGLTAQTTRFPEPITQRFVRESIDIVDLGGLPHEADPVWVARALVALVGCWVISRRG